MNSVPKIIHKEHDKNNQTHLEFFKSSTFTRKNSRIRKINDSLEIALWNMEKRIKDLMDIANDE